MSVMSSSRFQSPEARTHRETPDVQNSCNSAGWEQTLWLVWWHLAAHVLATIVEMATEATAKQVEPENDTTIIGAIPLQGTEIV